MTMYEEKKLYQIIESALFASEEPLSVDRIISLFAEDEKPDKQTVRKVLLDLTKDYDEREGGIELKELASGFQFQVKAEFGKWDKLVSQLQARVLRRGKRNPPNGLQ